MLNEIGNSGIYLIGMFARGKDANHLEGWFEESFGHFVALAFVSISLGCNND
jgi:hypothetical protein